MQGFANDVVRHLVQCLLEFDPEAAGVNHQVGGSEIYKNMLVGLRMSLRQQSPDGVAEACQLRGS